MPRENDDPEQISYFVDDPDAPLPEAKDVVIGGPKPDKSKPNGKSGDRAPPDPSNETPAPDAERGLDELRRQLDREREASRAAERAAQEALRRAALAENRIGQANAGMVDHAIEAAERTSEQARQKFEQAMSVGDARAASVAQVEISDARANLLRLQEQKAMLEQEAEARKRAPPPQPPQRQDDGGNVPPIDAIATQLERTGFPRSAEWARKHPDQFGDRRAIGKIDGAHGYAVNVLGLAPESDAYFDKMEELLGVGAPPPREAPSSRRAAPAAPVAAGAAPNLRTGGGRRTIHLTPEQRQHARDVLGMSDEEYAAELADAQDRGKLIGGRR